MNAYVCPRYELGPSTRLQRQAEGIKKLVPLCSYSQRKLNYLGTSSTPYAKGLHARARQKLRHIHFTYHLQIDLHIRHSPLTSFSQAFAEKGRKGVM